MNNENTRKKSGKASAIIVFTVSGLLITLGFLMLFSAIWFTTNFNTAVGLDAVIFTLLAGVEEADPELINSYILDAAVTTVLCSAVLIAAILVIPKLIQNEKFRTRFTAKVHKLSALGLAAVLFLSLFLFSGIHVDLFSFIAARLDTSVLFDERYVHPNDVEISFPEEKRNLIYIYLESMEISYMDEENSGALETNLIPELTELAQNNLNFSHNEGVGGAQTTVGSTWTIAAMITQTSGVPLCLPAKVNRNSLNRYAKVLPGLTNLTNILHENGYTQSLMVGSDGSFGGRKEFFTQHDMDNVYDLFTAREDGFLPSPDYHDKFWGYEDYYLFHYAQAKITEQAQSGEPFAFTLLTVDTHHPAGHPCIACQRRSIEGMELQEAKDTQFEDVLNCSSRQVTQFVEWIQKQDFYENTTVIITGDHTSMNKQYFAGHVAEDYTRRVYNCFLNTPIEPVEAKNREFTTLDMFPTTLAALGCTIEGDQLGLGVNLFSDRPTLAEELGMNYLNAEITKVSPYYQNNFLYGTKQEEQ
ncbi:MAG: LTA synthase family protein [Clostridia bacterium]|nr:LTA synthase family protein [Clostridia bacterium]